jgi:hypothetical protein
VLTRGKFLQFFHSIGQGRERYQKDTTSWKERRSSRTRLGEAARSSDTRQRRTTCARSRENRHYRRWLSQTKHGGTFASHERDGAEGCVGKTN